MTSSRGALFLPFMIFILCSVFYWRYIPDDTFIALRYSENLASGQGFSYNSGEPSYGFTSPLWILLLALLRRFGADLVLTAKISGMAFGLLSILVLYFLAKEIMKPPLFAFLVALLFAYDPWFIRWSSSGMETPFALFLLLLGFLLWLKEGAYGLPLSSLLFGLATLARPEAGLFFALILIESLTDRYRRAKVWRSVIGYLSVIAPWLLFSFVQFGAITPHTLKAKYVARGNLSLMVDAVTRVGEIIGGTYLPYILLILTVLVFRRFPSCLRVHRVPLGWVIVLPLFYILGRLPPASRYLLLSFPFLVLLGFLSLSAISSVWGTRRKLQVTTILLAVVLALNTYLGWFLNYANCKRFAQGMEECHIYIGKWLRENTAPNAVVAAGDIGAIGYYSERRILDLGALTNPELIPLVRNHPPREIVEEGLYLELAEADYLVDRTTSPFSLVQNPGAGRLYEPLFYRSTPTLGLTAPHTEHYYSVYWLKHKGLDSIGHR